MNNYMRLFCGSKNFLLPVFMPQVFSTAFTLHNDSLPSHGRMLKVGSHIRFFGHWKPRQWFWCLLFGLLGPACALYAQPAEESIQATIDVDTWLEQALHTDSDTEKIRLADQSLNVARNIRYDGGVLRASVMLAEIATRSNNTDQALQYFLEAEAKAKALKNQSALTRINIALGDLFCAEKLYPNAARYYAEVIKSEPANIVICEKLADTYLADLRFDSAEVYYKRLIANYRQTQHYPGMVRIYQKIATVYDQHGNAGKSLYYYLPITTLINDHGSKSEQAMLYNNLGRQYVALRDFKKAVEYFQRAEDRCSYVPCDHPEVMYTTMP
jgi:tetratricopeptide (TPR) repeat protein